MRSSSRNWVAVMLCAVVVTGCTDPGIGDPCMPEAVPCRSAGTSCGYEASEAYVEASSVQCRSRWCLVYKLDNGTHGDIPSDPRVLCEENGGKEGCVTKESVSESIYCTCRCRGAQRAEDNCPCADGYECRDVLSQGGDGVRGGYCVKETTIQ